MIKILAKRRDGSKVMIRSHDYDKLRNVMNSRLRSGEIVDYDVLA